MRAAHYFVVVLLSLGLVAGLAQPAPATAPPSDESAAPVAVLALRRPWQGHLIVEPPDLVIYESRLAIQRRAMHPGADDYVTAVLDDQTYAGLMDRIRQLTAGARWNRWYEPLPHPSDQPTTNILVRVGTTTIDSAVFGRDACEGAMRAQVPENLCRLIAELAGVRLRDAKPWVPAEVEVSLRLESRARGMRTRSWPKGWPGIGSSRAKKSGDRYSIRLDGRHLAAVDRLLKGLGRSGLIVLAGKTWTAAYRVPYPGESEWRSRFDVRPPAPPIR